MTAPLKVIESKCTLCGRCIQSCVYDALSIQNETLIINTTKCEKCGLCITRCPTEALFLE